MTSGPPFGATDPRLGTGRPYAVARTPSAGSLAPKPRRPGSGGAGGVVAIVLASLTTALALLIVAVVVGPTAAAIGGVLALLPLTVVLLTIRWLDRWEPEPRRALWFAFLWGAGVSVLVALVGNELGAGYVQQRVGDEELSLLVTAGYVAPVVEETVKGLGVLLIFLFRRRYFDGVVDGIVYAATVAAGFAFTENILYFGRAGEGLALVFVLRAVVSPFAHVIFTACVGIALGIASRRRSDVAVVVAFPIGLSAAIGLHALWNASASLGASFLVLYVLVQIPIFLAAIGLALWLGRQEAAVVRARLGEYAATGWFTPYEVDMLSTGRGRRYARSWARRYGPTSARAMRSFQRHASDLAYYRQRQAIGRADLRSPGDEAALLAALQHDRARFASARAGR
jgi:RsiW-degrading membrane proteinase PrsW (M82 family)